MEHLKHICHLLVSQIQIITWFLLMLLKPRNFISIINIVCGTCFTYALFLEMHITWGPVCCRTRRIWGYLCFDMYLVANIGVCGNLPKCEPTLTFPPVCNHVKVCVYQQCSSILNCCINRPGFMRKAMYWSFSFGTEKATLNLERTASDWLIVSVDISVLNTSILSCMSTGLKLGIIFYVCLTLCLRKDSCVALFYPFQMPGSLPITKRKNAKSLFLFTLLW